MFGNNIIDSNLDFNLHIKQPEIT